MPQPCPQQRARPRQTRLAITAVACTAFAAGCQLAPKTHTPPPAPASAEQDRAAILPWRSTEPEVGVPAQIVSTWTDTVLQQSGKGAARGFGGRLYFYGNGDTRPIAVEGQLVVYAFDETDRVPTDNKPTKRYVFPPDQFKLHRSQSELGVSYSFWLPWDRVAGGMTDVSLIARFEPLRGGSLVVSEQSTVRLPGRLDGPKVVSEPPVAARIQAVQTVAHLEEKSNPPPPTTGQHGTKRLETTTIQLPAGTRAHHSATRRTPPNEPEAAAPAAGPVQTTISYRDPAGSTLRRQTQP